MTTTQCVICTRDSPHGYVCDECLRQLAADLYTLAWLASQLAITRSRQDRRAPTGATYAQHDRHAHCTRCAPDHTDPVQLSSTPLLVHFAAATAHGRLHNAFATWVRRYRWYDDWPRDTPASMAAFLIDHLDRIRQDPGAERLALNIEHHTKTALEVINPLDPDQQTYGVCAAELDDGSTCTAYLYGEPRASWVRCRRCDTQHDTRRRIEALERRMRVMYFRPPTLARLLPRLIERPVSASNIRNWHRDGRPIRTSTDQAGYLTYHTGDVIAVATATPTRNRKAG